MQYDIQVKSSTGSSQVFYFCVYQYTLSGIWSINYTTAQNFQLNVFFLPKSSATQGQAH